MKFKVPPRKLCARLVLYYAGYVTCKKTTESPRTTAGERRHELARAARRPVLHVSEQQHRPPVSACLRVTWSLCTLPPLFKKRDTLEARAESHLDPPSPVHGMARDPYAPHYRPPRTAALLWRWRGGIGVADHPMDASVDVREPRVGLLADGSVAALSRKSANQQVSKIVSKSASQQVSKSASKQVSK